MERGNIRDKTAKSLESELWSDMVSVLETSLRRGVSLARNTVGSPRGMYMTVVHRSTSFWCFRGRGGVPATATKRDLSKHGLFWSVSSFSDRLLYCLLVIRSGCGELPISSPLCRGVHEFLGNKLWYSLLIAIPRVFKA